MIPRYKPIIALGNVIGFYQIIPKTKDVENLHLIIPGPSMGIFDNADILADMGKSS